MSGVLILDYGTTNLDVNVMRGAHAEPRSVGRMGQAAAGNLRSHIQRELMVIPVTLTKLSAADYATVLSLFERGAQVPCRGTIFGAEYAGVTVL